MTTATIAARTMRPDDEGQVLGLLGTALAGGPTGRRTEEFFRWKHRDNPFGASPGLVAEADGQVVGVRLFLRWELTVGGRPVRAVRAVDTATHPDFQGRGIFRTLTLAALDELRADTDLVFNTPNASSRPGYLKMGWQPVGTVPVSLRPVRWVRFARNVRSASSGLPPGDAGATCELPPASSVFSHPAALDALLRLVEAGQPLGRMRTRRSLDYLRWRYADVPDLDYRVVTVSRHGELRGVAFARPRLRGALRELTLSEVLVVPGDRRTLRRLLTRAARGSGCDHVATHLTAADRAAGLACGYVTWPGIGMGLVTRPLRDGLAPDPLSPSSWQWSLGDLEVF
jgi:GNAT superfamily N-acetyltransferase